MKAIMLGKRKPTDKLCEQSWLHKKITIHQLVWRNAKMAVHEKSGTV